MPCVFCIRWPLILCALTAISMLPQGLLAEPDSADREPALSTFAPETVFIKGGRFHMGTEISDKDSAEYHAEEAGWEVEVRDFRIGKYPVTAGQFCAFLNSPEVADENKEDLYYAGRLGDYWYSTIRNDGGTYFAQKPDWPANQVTWYGAYRFCKWLGDGTGRKFRLPTEAEWEFAARGVEERTWPWGEEAPDKSMGPRWGAPMAGVGSYLANATPDGVFDMLAYITGEWCVNVYPDIMDEDKINDPAPKGDLKKSHRAIRGIYHKKLTKIPWWQEMFMVGGYHEGRTWTRTFAQSIEAPRQAAWYGFRVVEVVQDE